MNHFGAKIVKYRSLIFLVSLLLLIPSVWGYVHTRVNYDILYYLPDDIETMKGQDILVDEFGTGAYSLFVCEGMETKEVVALKQKIEKVENVEKVIWYDSLLDTKVPMDVLPEKIRDVFNTDNSTLMFIIFKTTTSSDETMDAIHDIRALANKQCFLSGMSAIVTDTKTLSESEVAIYVVIAVILSAIVLALAMESYLIPLFLLLSIGMAILYNMGSNVFLGEISYITKALSAVLQLGVTMDYSIFLWHSYQEQQKISPDDRQGAMARAINLTLKSVVGSSITTVAGFIALCFMSFALGFDLGVVMAKGVVLGVICCVTVLPSMIMLFDKTLEKTKHKALLPDLPGVSEFILKHYRIFAILLVILFIPAWYCQSKTEVYYNLDKSLPEDLECIRANTKLQEDFQMGAIHMLLLDRDIERKNIYKMTKEMDEVDGVKAVLGLETLIGPTIPESMIPQSIKDLLESDKYELMLVISEYQTATEEVNAQIDQLNTILKNYNPKGMLVGEAPCTKDLITITDKDFTVVSSVSILIVFVIIAFVFRSISLPVILILVIEGAIFINLGIPYLTGTTLPFIASIVIGTIQLGATVDYAILMTSRYEMERSRGADKKESILIAHKSSMKSIIISAFSFFSATFGVGLYSKIDMISSLCMLMSRGAIISMVAVLLFLPAMFMIFDPLIIKTSKGFSSKGGSTMKMKLRKKEGLKKNAARAIALMISGAMVFSNAMPASAANNGKNRLEKEETVYINASAGGETEKVTVSEWLKNQGGLDSLEDFTDLENVQNVKGDEEFTMNGDGSLIWQSNGNDIYYQGETEKELPVTMKVSYYLDGKKIDPEKLAGKSGTVKIRFDYYNHSSDTVEVDQKKYNIKTPFTMITAMILPSDVFSNVTVENGKVISDGDKNIVVGLAFPGLNDSLNLSSYDQLSDISIPDYVEVKADASDFELALTATVATTGSLEDLDTESIDDVADLKDDINELTDASDQLAEGTGELLDGMNTLSSSFGIYADGVSAADKGAKELAKGLRTLNSKKEELASGVDTLSKGIQTLKEGTQTLNKGLTSYTAGVSSLEEGIQSANSGTSQLKEGGSALSQGIADYTSGVETLNDGIQTLAGELSKAQLPDADSLKAVNTAAETLAKDAAQLQTFLTEMDEAIGGISKLNESLAAYQSSVKKARKALDSVDEKATKQVQEQLKAKAETAKNLRDKVPNGNKIVTDSAIESAIKSIKVEGAADEAKQILDAVLQVQFPSIEMDVSAVEILLKDMQTQAKVLEDFGTQTSSLTEALPQLTAGVGQLSQGSKKLAANNETLLEGMKNLLAGLDTLSGGLEKLQSGAAQLTANNSSLKKGSSSLDSGASQLKEGSGELAKGVKAYGDGVGQASSGADQLSEGTGKLESATGQLSDGIGQLTDGAGTLDEGMNEFNEEGIQKLSDLAGDNLENTVNRLKAVKKADTNYNSFAGMKDGTQGSVKFIIETAAIEKE